MEMGNNFKYIVYITTNITNNKFYIGVHKTDIPYKFDGYLGCGAFANKPSSYKYGKTLFHKAILKYGVSNFRRYTLKVFDNENDALELEKILVSTNLDNINSYNLVVGGNIPPIHTKKIYQYTLDGDFIKEWNSIIEYANANSISCEKVTKCIVNKNNNNSCYLTLKYYNRLNVENYNLSYCIIQYDINCNRLNSFYSLDELVKYLDLDKKYVTNAIFNKNKIGEYYFLKSDVDIHELLKNKAKYNKNYTPVSQYTITGEYIKTYDSISSVKKEYDNVNFGNIHRACKNKKTAIGFKWSFNKVDHLSLDIDYIKPKVKIAQYDLDGNLIKIWSSISECKQQYPKCLLVCKSIRSKTNGFIFKFYEEVKDIV